MAAGQIPGRRGPDGLPECNPDLRRAKAILPNLEKMLERMGG